jgi:pimeloyl-ACP methyl ester carboxylesterase
MKNVRKYGNAPFTVAAIHGGPGASGEMEPVAKELSRHQGTLEPLQTSATIKGQIRELSCIIKNHGDPPLTLIGHSWGAWLTMLYAVQHSSDAKKIILIGSGPFEEKYVPQIMETRLNRLNDEEKIQIRALVKALNNPYGKHKDKLFTQLGKAFVHTDSYMPSHHNETKMTFQYKIFQPVWKEADDLRRSGKLVELGAQLQCPVVAIHGDYDPHPFEGVEKPLSKIVKDFTFILLKNCGHYPWIEKNAKEQFYKILYREV